MRMTRSTTRGGWPALLALALLAGPAFAQDEGSIPDEDIAIGETAPDGSADGGILGDDGELIDPILYTDYAPLPDAGAPMDDGVVLGDDGEPVNPDAYTDYAPLPDQADGAPVDADCGDCEIQTFGGIESGGRPLEPAENERGPLGPDATVAGAQAGHQPEVSRAGPENICTSQAHYVAWLCEWQGFARP